MNGKDETNVNFKEIRKKFENLSTSEIFQNSKELPSPPTRPIRKPKGDICPTRKTSLDNEKYHNPNPSHSNGNEVVSVRERTKIFEVTKSTSMTETSPNNNTKRISHSKKDITTHKNTYSSPETYNRTPPIKPPRTFLHTEKKNGAAQFDFSPSVKKSDPNVAENFQRKSSSSSLNGNNQIDVVDSSKTHKLLNSSDPKNVFKSQNTSGKTNSFMIYLKNIATPANIREKIKQNRIFVDLTPTTVSPPKHYGTLKRSHSEEHIYAEPFEFDKSQVNKSPDSTNKVEQPLHYMCTPLVNPPPVKRNGENKFSRGDVRNMIYNSFAPLRKVSKDSQDFKSTTDSTEADTKAIQARIIYVKSIRQVSGSSICLAPKLYEALYIINVSESQPEVSYSFPLKVPQSFKYSLLPHICFPVDQLHKRLSNYQSETFYFTLHDKDEKVWGYCLRITGWPLNERKQQTLCVKLPVAVCILSYFNAPLFYKRLLSEIEKHLTLPREKCFKYIRSLQKLGIPNAGASVSIPDYTESIQDNRVVISRPFDSHTVGLELTRALQLLDVDILVKVVSSLLLERRVLLFSSCVSNLHSCCQAISSLLYPFEWPHMFVPVLPSCLSVHCCSDLPYIIGIPCSDYGSLLDLLAEHELLILDVDKGVIIKSCNDEDTILPKKVQRAVISALNLAKNMTDPTEMLRDIMISEAFVHMYVEMIGHYENYFIDNSENVVFQKDGFLKNAISSSIQTFLQWFSETQMFDTFINESIWRINYRKICQTDLRTFFEKRIDEYKWELSHEGEKFSRFIERTKNFGGKLFSRLKK